MNVFIYIYIYTYIYIYIYIYIYLSVMLTCTAPESSRKAIEAPQHAAEVPAPKSPMMIAELSVCAAGSSVMSSLPST